MKIAGFSISSLYPPIAGGAHRLFNINLQLSNECNVFHFALMPSEYVYIKKARLVQCLLRMADSSAPEILVGSKLTQINRNYAQYTFANPLLLIFDRIVKNPDLPEFVPSLLDHKSLRTARRAITDSDLVQIATPWMFDWVQKNTLERKPMVLWEEDALCRSYRKQTSERILRVIREKEEKAVTTADAVIVLSKEDRDVLCDEYDIKRSKVHPVSYGIDASRIRPPSEEEKADLKTGFGLSGKTVILFTGSAHFPNVVAVEAIHHIASKMKDDHVLFLIAGSVGDHVRKRALDNIRYTGYVKDIRPYFRLADVAINPVQPYSTLKMGVHTKVIEYLANGLPTVTTSFGSRGLPFQDGKHVIISDIEMFPEKIEELVSNKEARQRLGEEGRKIVEECFNWQTIARKVLAIYKSVLT